MGILLWSSFRTGRPGFPGGTYTLNNYVTAYLDPSMYSVLFNTLMYAGSGVFIALTISISFAWLLECTNIPLRNLGYALLLVPMAIPGMLFTISWVMLLTPTIGFINVVLRGLLHFLGIQLSEGPFNIYSLPGMYFLDGLRHVPTIFLMIVGGFRMMDPTLEEAALVAGAGKWYTLRNVTIPVLFPTILVAFIYSFIGSLESFEIPAVIGIPAGIFVFSTKIYFEVNAESPPNFGLANAFAVTFISVSLALLYWYTRATRVVERFATVTGKGYRPRVLDLGKWRYFALALILFYFTLAVVLPLFILLWNSLMPYYQAVSLKGLSRLSLQNYYYIFKNPLVGLALRNTLSLVISTPIVTMLLAFMIGWLALRTQIRGRRALDVISFLPHTMSSVVIGLALVLVYLNFPIIPIYGTIWIVGIGFITKYIAFGTRTAVSAIMQLHKDLEEAAAVSGATPFQKITRITLPLVAPVFINGCIWVAVHTMRELSIALMLFSKKNLVISTILWQNWQEGHAGATAALGVMLILALVVITTSGRIFVSKLSKKQ
jgi:iron(III) transport system permease protein